MVHETFQFSNKNTMRGKSSANAFESAEELEKDMNGHLENLSMEVNPVFGKLEVEHPKPGESLSIRVVDLNDLERLGCHFGRFQYELPHEDEKYLRMQQEIDVFYRRLTQKHEGRIVEFSLIRSGVPVIVKYYDGNFKRAELLWDLIEGQEDNFVVSIGLLDEHLPVMTIRLEDLYYLDRRFSRLSPRKRFFSLQELELYKDVRFFRTVILNTREDIFTGALEAEFVKNDTEADGCGKRDSATVCIRGAKYPTDRFPLGLNGLLIEKIYEMMSEPGVPDVNFKRRDAFVVGGSNYGDAFITFHTFVAIHLLSRINKLHGGDMQTVELMEKFKGRVDSPLSSNEIYLAPYADDGLYYRAKYLSPAKGTSEDKMVNVFFIDYGTIQAVCIKDLVVASKVDYLFGIFPPLQYFICLAIKVHLAGVEYMDSERLAEVIDPDEFCIVKTVKAACSKKLPEVEIRRQQCNESKFQSINEEIVHRIGTRRSEACSKQIQALTNMLKDTPPPDWE